MALDAAVSFSCNKENIEGNGNAAGEEVVLYAPQSVIKASSVETKTALSGLEILWEAGDVISLFNENGTPMNYSLISGENTTSGEFRAESEPETGYSYAIYPAVSGQVAGTSVSVTVAQNQTYLAEGFSTEFPMGARTGDGLNFTFSNLATVLSLPLQGDAVVRSISIEAVGGEGLAGDATVDFSGATPVLAAAGDASPVVTLDCGEEGVQLSADAATVFNFILIPGEYSGLKVSVTDVNGSVTERTTGALALVAGSIKNFNGSLTVSSAPQGWNLVGAFTNWQNSWYNFVGRDGFYYCEDVTVPEGQNEFQVRYSESEWYGNGSPIGLNQTFILYRDAGNVDIENGAGTYDFYFDEDRHSVVIVNAGEILPLVVSGTCNAWGDTPFTMDENGLMIAENVTFTNPEDGSKARFKIRFANDTDFSDGYNIGSPDDNPKEGTFSVTAKSSKDINVTPGTYDITFDFKTMTVTLTASQN